MDLREILQAYEALDPQQQHILVRDLERATGSMRWVPNPGPQTEAYFCEADELFYGGQAGGGKALANDTGVLTPTGWRPIGGLKVGDSVCAPDGTVQEVIGVYPQGVRPLYRVTMCDGASVLADDEHNWLAWRSHANRKGGGEVLCGQDSARKWTTRQMREEMGLGPRADGRGRGFRLPVMSPARFNVAGQLRGKGAFVGREVDPYLLGLILGDGHLGEKRVTLTTADQEIVDWVVGYAGGDVAVDATTSRAVSLRFRGEVGASLLWAVERLGLRGTKAGTKFIPRQYLFAPVDARFELLRGLMDTDGWVEEKRAVFFTSVSRQLAEDVAHLAGSLGMVTSTTDRVPSYTYEGKKKRGQAAYTVRIKALHPEECFALQRKRKTASTIRHQSLSRAVESIVYDREGEATCISVSGPASLYITEGFIVTHNTDMMCGLSLTQHTASLLLRRTNKESLGLIERMAEIVGNRDGWSGQAGIWRLEDRTIEISGCQLEDDKQKFKGRPHDLIAFDEVSDFSESQYLFITTWNRSTLPGQRCRVLACGNPPTRPEGLWVIKRWAPWLDPLHPRPAKPGELRWFIRDDLGEDTEVDGPGPHMVNGEPIIARSRTFIPATLADNPDLSATGYASVLAALPPELRAAYRDGRFDAGLKDDAFQVIPTAWIRMAQARWKPQPPAGVPMCAIGVDASGGGTDPMILAPRYDGWFAPIVEVPGRDIPVDRAGAYGGGMVMANRKDQADIIIDMSGGYGSAMFEHLRNNHLDPISYKGAEKAHGRDRTGKFTFANKRSAAIYRFREALDPEAPGGSTIMLPQDPTLVADLTAPTYEIRGGVIHVEPKEKVVARLGRSTDRGDAVVMSWSTGLKMANIQGGFQGAAKSRVPTVNRGRRK